MSKKVVINQLNYLPWKGYFDLIHDADVFIFLDDVQYTKNDWRNRNRIKGPNGSHWLTIPIGSHMHSTTDDILLPEGTWRQKHWKSLQQSYGTAPFFNHYRTFFESVYHDHAVKTLSQLNQYLTKTIAREFLRIETEIVCSSDLTVSGKNSDRVLGLVQAVGGSTYISGPAAQAYLNLAEFYAAGVEVIWKSYEQYPSYSQLYPPFEHSVSIVDLLFSVGPDAPNYIWGEKQPPLQTANLVRC